MNEENGLTAGRVGVRVRRALPSDAAAVAELAARTFGDAFGRDNRPEDMAAHLSRTYGERQQRAEIEHPDIVTLVAEENGPPVAFAQVRRGPVPPCVADDGAVELARFYVDRAWQGHGVAQILMRDVDKAARDLGGTAVWLGVWERNPRAIAFYAKCGFGDVGSQIFILGSDPQTDRVMVRQLRPAADTD